MILKIIKDNMLSFLLGFPLKYNWEYVRFWKLIPKLKRTLAMQQNALNYYMALLPWIGDDIMSMCGTIGCTIGP